MKTEKEIKEEIKQVEKDLLNYSKCGLYLMAYTKEVELKTLKSVLEEEDE